MVPHVWKFFWAPIVDTKLTRKRWYVISAVVCAAGITAMSAIPLAKQNMFLLECVIFVTNLASTFLGMSVEGLMAHATPPEQRGRVGGWFQAGNLGGSGLGGGAGLWMATNLPSPWMSGAVLGLIFMAGSSMLRFVPDASADARATSLLGAMRGVLVELWQVAKSRSGILCTVLCILPIGTGAASGVLAQAAVAAKWGVGENTVSLVNGVLNGLVSALGCLVGGEICTLQFPAGLRGGGAADGRGGGGDGGVPVRAFDVRGVYPGVRVHHGAFVRGVHGFCAGCDREGGGGDEVQRVRIALKCADCVHGAGAGGGVHAAGGGGDAVYRGRGGRAGDRGAGCGGGGAAARGKGAVSPCGCGVRGCGLEPAGAISCGARPCR